MLKCQGQAEGAEIGKWYKANEGAWPRSTPSAGLAGETNLPGKP